jgi:pimeloyl-ACP methyl ester carboxylesterase
MLDAASQAGACPPGSRFPLLPGVRSRIVATPRLAQHVYESGPPAGPIVVFVHGNASSARFFEETMAALPDWHIVAPDLRGYGATEARPADATRGLRDYADDIEALVATLGIARFHLLGWSLGGNIAMQYTIDHPERVQSLTLLAAGSPFGYGATHGAEGTPNDPEFAGSGGGLISPEVVARYQAKDDTADSPFSARSALRALIVKPTFHIAPEREDVLVEQMLMMVIGDQFYPGDSVPATHWPFRGPGVWGSNNTLSPKYLSQRALAEISPQPAILWVRGADDLMVSNTAAVDPGTLGQMGVIPGWPGADVYPPQPMLDQIRALLDRYAANGGTYREVVLPDCGHAPPIEHPAEFQALVTGHWRATATESAGGSQPAQPRGVFGRLFHRQPGR